MRTITIADRTMVGTYYADNKKLSFREKLEIARLLDKLRVDVIEFPLIQNEKTDPLLVRTVAKTITNSILSQPVGDTPESVELAWSAVSAAQKPRLSVIVPTSPTVMEYVYHKKAKVLAELVPSLVQKAREYTADVEFCAVDATRSDPAFLSSLITSAIEAGATTVTLCDTASLYLPDEFTDFIAQLHRTVPALSEVRLGVSCADGIGMAAACSAAAVIKGIDEIKCAVNDTAAFPSIETLAAFLKARGDSLTLSTTLNLAQLSRMTSQIKWILGSDREAAGTMDTPNPAVVSEEGIALDRNATAEDVGEAVRRLGYDLTEEDLANVYGAFRTIAEKKPVSDKELDLIVATNALQVPPTYQLDSFLITNSNLMPTTAQVILLKGGEKLSGVCSGDGPIDAAFVAIESVIGHHYELDEFRIQAVTEGHEAMGSALIRLRSDGKLYAGNGVSTDIIGASIRAYLNALNKIVYDSAAAGNR